MFGLQDDYRSRERFHQGKQLNTYPRVHSRHSRDECVDFLTLLLSLVVFRGSVLPRQEQKVQQLPECRLEV